MQMLQLVYAAVIILAFIAFRSWRAVLCAVLPLMAHDGARRGTVWSVWASALKVATLPVIALGVGIGVDYALYVLTVTLAASCRRGLSSVAGLLQGACSFGEVVVLTRRHAGYRGRDVGFFVDQVPGRHGHPASDSCSS